MKYSIMLPCYGDQDNTDNLIAGTRKLYECSLLRFFAMVLVICCHTFQQIGYALGESSVLGIVGDWCAVGVQIFLILSGFLYGKRNELFQKENRIDFILRNFNKITLDYFVYMMVVIFPIYMNECGGVRQSLSMAFKLLTFSGTLWGVHHLWFIPYILLCYFLTPFLYDLKSWSKEKNCTTITFVVLCGVIEVIDVAFESYFIGAWIVCYVIGFFLPEIVSRLSEPQRRMLVTLLSMMTVPITYLWYETRYVVQPQFEAGLKRDILEYLINYTRTYDALLIVLLILFVCSNRWITNGTVKKFLDFSDRYSFDIYIAHMIYIKGVLTLLDLTGSYLINVCLMLTASIGSGIVLYHICALLKKIGKFSLLKRDEGII